MTAGRKTPGVWAVDSGLSPGKPGNQVCSAGGPGGHCSLPKQAARWARLGVGGTAAERAPIGSEAEGPPGVQSEVGGGSAILHPAGCSYFVVELSTLKWGDFGAVGLLVQSTSQET